MYNCSLGMTAIECRHQDHPRRRRAPHSWGFSQVIRLNSTDEGFIAINEVDMEETSIMCALQRSIVIKYGRDWI
jgi:hypothetical protein